MIPDAYYKSIFEIDYNNLKEKGYKNIFFDVDNTLVQYTESLTSNETKVLINSLKNDFNIIIASNSMSNRVLKIVDELGVKGYYSSMKPTKKVYKKVKKEYNKDECIFIGDQFMTDVLGAKRSKFKIILVDRINNSEPLVTKFWRFFEKRILNYYKKNNKFNIYNYYDNLK